MLSINYLSIDYGEKYIGLGIFHEGLDPYPLKYGRIRNDRMTAVLKEIYDIIVGEEIHQIIIGLPRFPDGKDSKMTKVVQEFVDKIYEVIKIQSKEEKKIDIYYQDETLSTYEAEQRMKTMPEYNFKIDLSQIDALSAVIILEDYLKNTKKLF